MDEKNVITVMAMVDIDPSQPAGSAGRWNATCLGPHPLFKGLFALGADFASARAALAEIVWAQAKPAPAAADATAVRVLATTRKTFPVTTLDPSPGESS